MIIPQPIKPVLFGWGSCSDCKNTNIPHRLKLPKGIESPEKVFASEGCNVILEKQNAYSWSNNKYSRSSLGRKRGSLSNQSTPHKIAMNGPVQKMSQSHNHTLLLTSTKEVYGFGENTDNKLGLPKKKVQLPTRINVKDCIDVACGASSSVFLLKDGSVKTAGLGGANRIAGSNLRSISFPVPISTVACGSSHTVVLSKNRKCYSFGCPDNGRLGLGNDIVRAKMITSPRLVDLQVQVKQVACGSAHTLLLSVDGNVYAFGWNQFGQCGVDPAIMADVHVPSLIKGTEQIFLLKAGFAHSAIVTVDAQLFTFGNNENGQLGIGNETNESNPTKLLFHHDSKDPKYCVIDVDCGNLFTLALVVPVDFQEYQENKSLIHRMKCGILVLEKFARLVLLQRRIRIIRETLKSRGKAQVQKVKPRIISSPLSEQDQSEYSDESSIESSNHSIDEVTQVASTLDEQVAFESEDEISKLMTRRILRLEAYKQKKKLILLTEVKREQEQIRMFHEDRLSRKKSHQDRIERLGKHIQARIVDETRIEDQSKLSTVKQEVQKPLQTMKKKKKTKRILARPMKSLSQEKNICLRQRKEPSKPKMPSKKRNNILLERRQARLLQQALKEQQEQERIAKEERQRQLHENATKKRQESIELEGKESILRRKMLLSNLTKKKKRLHNTINTRRAGATNPDRSKKIFGSSFKSVSDWNHQL